VQSRNIRLARLLGKSLGARNHQAWNHDVAGEYAVYMIAFVMAGGAKRP
jgi:hypothetical protein